MAIKFVQTPDGSDDSIRFQPMERLMVGNEIELIDHYLTLLEGILLRG